MSQAIRVVAILIAKAGKESQVEQILRACVQPSRAEDGCLSYVLNRCIEQAGVLSSSSAGPAMRR